MRGSLDYTNLQDYLEQLDAAPVLIKALQSVFEGEYGQAIYRQSCLNFMLFAKLTRSQSRIVYFGRTTPSVTPSPKATRRSRGDCATTYSVPAVPFWAG